MQVRGAVGAVRAPGGSAQVLLAWVRKGGKQCGWSAGCEDRLARSCFALPWPSLLSCSPTTQPTSRLLLAPLQADGGTRCACINAAFMALAAAAVPMRDILASCAAGYLESTALLDLNYVEVRASAWCVGHVLV